MQLIAHKILCLCDFILSAPWSRWSLSPFYRGAKWSRGLNDLLVVMWPATGWVTIQTAQLQILSTLNDHYFFLTHHRFCRVWLVVLHLARFPAMNWCLRLFLFMVVKMEPKAFHPLSMHCPTPQRYSSSHPKSRELRQFLYKVEISQRFIYLPGKAVGTQISTWQGAVNNVVDSRHVCTQPVCLLYSNAAFFSLLEVALPITDLFALLRMIFVLKLEQKWQLNMLSWEFQRFHFFFPLGEKKK